MAEIFLGSSWEGSRMMTMITVSTITMTTRVTTMMTTTAKILVFRVFSLDG